MSAYLGSTKVWEKADENGWVRPSDWLDLPSVSPTDEKVVGLCAVWEAGGNFVSIRAQGAFTVDWGDGVTENFSTDATAHHAYTYSSVNSVVSLRGYKQAIVTVTPQAGQHLTYVNFNIKHNQSGLTNSHATLWLDVLMSVPYCTAITFGGTTVKHALVERFRLISSGALTSLYNFFQACTRLVSFSFAGATLGSVTNLGYMFNIASSVRVIDFSGLSFGAITTLDSFARECGSLQKVVLTGLNTSSVTTVTYFVYLSPYVSDIDLTGLSWSSSLTATGAFTGTKGLKRLIFACPVSFDISNNVMSATALDALYTSLPTVSGKTITVTGNYGTSGHTPSIATAKGWTVTA